MTVPKFAKRLPGRIVANLRKMLYTLVEIGNRIQFLSQDPNPEVPNSILELVRGMLPGQNREHLVHFLQGQS